MWVSSLGWEDPLEKGMATQSGILAWRIPWTKESWQARVHRVAKSRTQLKQLSMARKNLPFSTKTTWLHSPVEAARSSPENIWLFNAHPWDLPQDSFFMGLGTSLVVNFVLVSGTK